MKKSLKKMIHRPPQEAYRLKRRNIQAPILFHVFLRKEHQNQMKIHQQKRSISMVVHQQKEGRVRCPTPPLTGCFTHQHLQIFKKTTQWQFQNLMQKFTEYPPLCPIHYLLGDKPLIFPWLSLCVCSHNNQQAHTCFNKTTSSRLPEPVWVVEKK